MKGKKTQYIFFVVFFLVSIGFGVAIGYSILLYFGDDLRSWVVFLRLFEGVLLMFLGLFLQIILHESGHMIAALLRGWKFISFMVLGWVLSRKNGKFHFNRFSIAGAGGQCLMSPPAEGDTDRGIAVYNAGGILMNIVTSLLALLVLAWGYTFLPWDVAIFLVLFALMGLSFALLNGIPAVMDGLPNDGKNIQQLHKDAFATKTFLSTMRFMGRMQQGEVIEQVVPDYLCEGQGLDYANPIHQSALCFDVSLAIARLNFDKAYTLFSQIDAHDKELVDIFRKELTFEKVYLYLVSPRNDCDVKELMSEDFLKYMDVQCAFRPTALRTQYTYALLYEHDVPKAEKLRSRFDRVCHKYHIPGEVNTEQKLVEYAASLNNGCADN